MDDVLVEKVTTSPSLKEINFPKFSEQAPLIIMTTLSSVLFAIFFPL